MFELEKNYTTLFVKYWQKIFNIVTFVNFFTHLSKNINRKKIKTIRTNIKFTPKQDNFSTGIYMHLRSHGEVLGVRTSPFVANVAS